MTITRRVPYLPSMAAQRGFTLVELIAVIIIVGILGSFAATRFIGRASFDSVAFADQSAALLRYAQKVAVAQNRYVYARVQANGIALCYDSGCTSGNRVLAPGGTNSNSAANKLACADTAWACEAPPSQVRITPLALFYFDALGKPFLATDVPPTAVSLFTTRAFTVTADTSVRTITIEMETGYVH
ncbi:pilus assembly FimT family protein [Massilia sp. TSP1-1-2]|uniref:pilus assembly FimT family protein n=1 Tax=unclassified Massilia TaxID=2609279 RepID=UPI003CF150A7